MWPGPDRYTKSSRYLRLHSAEAALRKTARNTRVLKERSALSSYRIGDKGVCLPSDDIDAPDNRNNLSPIWIGNTFRGGSTIGIEGSSSVRLCCTVPVPDWLRASVSLADALLRLSEPSVSLCWRVKVGPLWERVLCAGGLASTGDAGSSPDSDIIREARFWSGCVEAPALSRSGNDFRLLPAIDGGTFEGCLGTAKAALSLLLEPAAADGNGQWAVDGATG